MTKVLIIEDNNDIRENVVEILSLSGYRFLKPTTEKKAPNSPHKTSPMSSSAIS